MTALSSHDYLKTQQAVEIQYSLEHQMTCVAEKITPELWEQIKTDLGPQYRLHIERRRLDDMFIGRDRIVHVETGNYMCPAPVMIRDKSSGWFFYIMCGRAICFRVDDPTRTMLEFYNRNESFSEVEYTAFQAQATEIFGVAGFKLCIPEGWTFVPQFPVLKRGAK